MKVTSKYASIKGSGSAGIDCRFLRSPVRAGAVPNGGGLLFVLDQVAVRDPRAKDYTPEGFIDLRFVKQLEDRGFINSLYPKG